MAHEVVAAIIQGASVVGAAWWVSSRGLSTWENQIRARRRIEQAEQSLAAADPMFRAIRNARLRWFRRWEKRTSSDRRITRDSLNQAWRAWERFQGHYKRAGHYGGQPGAAMPPAAPRPRPAGTSLDVAAEVAECIGALQQHVNDEEWDKFYRDASQPPDPIEERLLEAERALDEQLRPILRPEKVRYSGGRLARLRAAWRGE